MFGHVRLSSLQFLFNLRFGSLWLIAAAIAMVLGNSSPAISQNTAGAITGKVMDPSEAVIAGATVTATNIATGLSRSVTTGAQGTFRFDSLQPGEYQVKVEAKGFATQTQKLVVQVATTTASDFAMRIGQATEIV